MMRVKGDRVAGLDRSLISGLALFQGMTPAEQEAILRGARSTRYPKESAVFEQDAEAQSFFVLLDGHIRVVRTTPDGQQIIARYIGEGEIFGVAAALGRTTYPASAIAAVDCVVLVWPNALWPELSARFPAFGANTFKTVGSRLQETQTRVVEMSTEQVEQRVAHALLRLVSQTGRKTEAGIEIDFPISRQDIAEMTGTTLHTVSRLLSAWEDKGIIVSGRQKVTVADPHRLVTIAEKPRG
uniref:Putative transcriptional regulator Crp/Fnr family protein n=1 Tax=uncultured bacterium 1042 TaxID=548897 RepID=B8R8S8_9BACT|nr:putative transcriptional regulator Crp/Fnr family protein [uncultured bacterium 1042]